MKITAPLLTVASKPQPSNLVVGSRLLQRKCASGASTLSLDETKCDVRKALDSPAIALSGEMNAELSKYYGRNFGDVRVHVGSEVGHSALALGAEAYTVGRDIVFAPGAYQPGNPDGRRLIAHEVFHVAQQDGKSPSIWPLYVDASSSIVEREADRAAARFGHTGNELMSAPRPRHGPPALQRSVLGSIIGGLLGGASGAGIGMAIGSLLGPVGMIVGGVIGGIAGLAGGAIVGDSIKSRRSRSLTVDETKYLKEIFQDSVDYSLVTITRGSALSAGAARTTGNTVNLEDQHFVGNTMNLTDAGHLVLVHEMGHVWQYQNGGLAYIPSSLIPQAVAGDRGDRSAAYVWRDAVRNHIDWADWNAEQQAECISDYNKALRRLKADQYPDNARGGEQRLADIETEVLAENYIERVREGVGAPGSRRRSR